MAICLPAISIMSEFNFIVQFHTKLTVFMHLKDILLFTKYRSEISAQDSLLNILNSYITAMQSISSKAFTKCIHKCIISFQFKGSLTKQYSGKLTQYFRSLCLYLKCLKQKKCNIVYINNNDEQIYNALPKSLCQNGDALIKSLLSESTL